MKTPDEMAAKIYNTLHGQRFADWYSGGGNFDRHICGDLPTPTKEEILNDIKKMFDLN